jgi:hypothetical protein
MTLRTASITFWPITSVPAMKVSLLTAWAFGVNMRL